MATTIQQQNQQSNNSQDVSVWGTVDLGITKYIPKIDSWKVWTILIFGLFMPIFGSWISTTIIFHSNISKPQVASFYISTLLIESFIPLMVLLIFLIQGDKKAAKFSSPFTLFFTGRLFLIVLLEQFMEVVTANFLSEVILSGVGIFIFWQDVKKIAKRFWKHIGMAAILMLVGIAIIYILRFIENPITNLIKDSVGHKKTTSTNEKSLDDDLTSPKVGLIIVTFMFVVFVAPFFEEFVYRKGIMDMFKGKMVWVGAAISAVTFGMMHIHLMNSMGSGSNKHYYLDWKDFTNSLAYVFPGIGFSAIYFVGKNLFVNYGIHATLNLVSVIVTLVRN